jgi:hypothetical protein
VTDRTRPPDEPGPPVAGGADQLELLEPFDDGLDFDEWMRSLPLNPAEDGRA